MVESDLKRSSPRRRGTSDPTSKSVARKPRTLLLAGPIASSLVLFAVAGWAKDFAYPIPAGFLDLSPGAPAANFSRVSPALVEQARPFHGYAVLLENEQPMVVFTVTVKENDLSVTEVADGIAAGVSERKDYSGARILAQEKVSVNGFECAKIEFVGTVDGEQFSKLSYVLPIGSERALMSLDGKPQDLAKVRDAFELSVRNVSGLAQASEPRQSAKIGVALGVLLLVAAGLMQRYRRKQKRPVSKLREQTDAAGSGSSRQSP